MSSAPTEQKTREPARPEEAKAPAQQQQQQQSQGPVKMWLHASGWLRREHPEGATEPPSLVFDVGASFAKPPTFEAKLSDPYEPTRRYTGFYTPDMCGEPQIPEQKKNEWPGRAAFLNDVVVLSRDYAEVVKSPVKLVHCCMLCSKNVEYDTRYSYGSHMWPGYFFHYLKEHSVIPEAEFYELVRDANPAKLMEDADMHMAWEGQQAYESCVKLATVRSGTKKKPHMTPEDLRKAIRPLFPPPFAWKGRPARMAYLMSINKRVSETLLLNEESFDRICKIEVTNKEARRKLKHMRAHGFVEVNELLGRVKDYKDKGVKAPAPQADQ